MGTDETVEVVRDCDRQSPEFGQLLGVPQPSFELSPRAEIASVDDEELRSAFHDRPQDGPERKPGAIVTANSKLDVRRGLLTDRRGFEGCFYSIRVVGMDDGEKALSRALVRQTAKQAPERPVFKEDLAAVAEDDHWIQRMVHQRSDKYRRRPRESV